MVGVDNRQMTFKELDEASDVLALNLRLKGAREDCIVGIYMERSVDCVIAYIGILKAGMCSETFNTFAPGRCAHDLKFKKTFISKRYILSVSREITLRWIPQDCTDD